MKLMKASPMIEDSKNVTALVIPCFNESNRLNINYYNSLIPKLTKIGGKIYFVNDGSTDKTEQLLLDNFAGNCEILSLQKNYGKAEAIRKGLNYIIDQNEFKYIGYLDSDCAFSIEDILNIVMISNSDKTHNAFFASRVMLAGHNIHRNPWRHFIGRAISTLINFNLQTKIYDPQCGLKVFQRNLINRVGLQTKFKTKWFIDVELILRIRPENMSILEIPVKSWRDVKGSKLKLTHFPKIIYELATIIYAERKA